MNQTHGLHTVAIDDRLHRVTVREACADEGGVPHEPVLAKPRRDDGPAPRGYFWWLFLLAVDLVAACFLLALVVGPK